MKKPVIFYRGRHGAEVRSLIEQAWAGEICLVLVPPRPLKIKSFFSFFGNQPIKFQGDWEDQLMSHSLTDQKDVIPEDISFGLFSSGSTNKKDRLILYTKKNIQSALAGVQSFYSNFNIQTIFCYPQPYHIFGLVLGYIWSIEKNIELVGLEGDYHKIFHKKWIQAKRREFLLTLGTPTHFRDLVDYLHTYNGRAQESLSAIVGGASVKSELWHMIRRELKINYPSCGYGLSEASPAVAHLAPGVGPSDHGQLGQLIPGVKVTPNEQGYLFEGPNLCRCYIEDSHIHFPKSLQVYDLIEQRNKDWFFVGRSNLILNRGGEKFQLEVMEQALWDRYQQTFTCIAVADDRLGEELAILSEGPAPKGLYLFLLAQFKRRFPKSLYFVIEKIPLNVNAKVDRKKCKELLEYLRKDNNGSNISHSNR